MIFVLASETFPTVYRGTFYGIAAAGGKTGAIIIRAIIGATGNKHTALGIRLLVFAPLMLLAAGISYFLPDVQYVPLTRDTEAAGEHQRPIEQQPPIKPQPPVEQQITEASQNVSQSRLRNMTLEEIAPNPTLRRRRRRKRRTRIRTRTSTRTRARARRREV